LDIDDTSCAALVAAIAALVESAIAIIGKCLGCTLPPAMAGAGKNCPSRVPK